MNVLVYNGPGVSKTSLSHTLSTLKALLTPNYTVNTITPQSLALDPWSSNCALLVLPGGRDLPYLSSLQKSNETITSFVRNGGSFLGFCAGAYYACRRVEWEVGTDQEVSGDRPLRFFNGIGRGCVFPGFKYETEDGARAVTVSASNGESGHQDQFNGLYYNGGGEFVDAENIPDTEVIARYTEGDGKIASVFNRVGNGRSVLWAIHPEYALSLEPAISAINNTRPDLNGQINQLEERRWELMKHTLTLLGLNLPSANLLKQIHTTPQFLTSISALVINDTISSLVKDTADGEPIVLESNSDTFHIYQNSYSPELFERLKVSSDSEGNTEKKPIRSIIIFPSGTVPPPEATRAFNISLYYSSLSEAQKRISITTDKLYKMGETLLYGEVVTSTQTLLDKNPKLLSHLPIPTLSVATNQISGRGRGSNSWLSPPGCLQFSLLLRLPLASFPASKLVFIQYLFGLAVVEACRSSDVLGAFGDRVRLKWPNDIYAITDRGMKKIGGILVNTSFMASSVDIVIGCGLNVLSPSPLTSLSHLIPPGIMSYSDTSAPELSMERTCAAIMATFDGFWSQFVASRGSFDPFMDLYLQRWLHSDQQVQLTTVDPPQLVRIVGITPEHGLLRTMPENRGGYLSNRGDAFIDLQPDGNSFDLMAGLIKAKQ